MQVKVKFTHFKNIKTPKVEKTTEKTNDILIEITTSYQTNDLEKETTDTKTASRENDSHVETTTKGKTILYIA